MIKYLCDSMKYSIDGIECNVIVEKKNNKNTYLRVKENNEILITTNYFISKKQILKILEVNEKFILKNLERLEKKQEKNDKFYLLGKEYNIILLPNSKVEIIDNNIYVDNYRKLELWLNKEMKKLFLSRLDYIYNKFEENIPYPSLRIREMKTRWGVCNKKLKVVTLNSELLRYDLEKLDYVITHELSHFIHFDHSKSFWLLVEKYCPNYKKIRKELRD